MRKIQSGIVCFLLLSGSVSALKADSLFDFENVPLGTPTQFSDTNNGLTATFTSFNPAGTATPGAFIVWNNPFNQQVGSGLNLYENDATPPYNATGQQAIFN